MPAMTEPKLISGNANRPLASAIARRMSMHRGMNVGLVGARVERFNDGEIFVEVFENVRGEDMYIIQPTSNPANDNLMELLIMVDALRRSSATRITAVIPYFGYARQDRRAKARTPISAKLVANLLTEAGVDRVLTLDLHAAQIQGFFDIPVDNLYASPVFGLDIKHHFAGQLGDIMVISPDVGGVARARDLAQRLGAPLAIVDKRREKAGEVAGMTVIGDVSGKKCIIVDDICDTAGTSVQGRRHSDGTWCHRGAQLHHPWRAFRPGSRADQGVGDEVAGHHRFDRADGGGAVLPQYPHCAGGTDVCAGGAEHLERHQCFVAVRNRHIGADLRRHVFARLIAGGWKAATPGLTSRRCCARFHLPCC